MSRVEIRDFKFGLNRQRPRDVGVPGMLWDIKNAHLSRGGDIEGAKKWAPLYSLPAGTFGMHHLDGQLYTFGSEDLAASMPAGVQYKRCIGPAGAMVRVLHANAFGGKLYVIAEFSDGSVHHFYDGSRVTGWDAIATANSALSTVADYLARKVDANAAVEAQSYGENILLTAITPGTAFTVSASAADGGAAGGGAGASVTTLQANVTAVAEVRATGTVTVTGGSYDPGVNKIGQVTVNGGPLLAAPVDWLSSNNATAAALSVAINNNSSASGYAASAVGAVVTVRAAVGTGVSPNGYAVAVSPSGDVTASTANMAGGVTAVAAVAQISRVALTAAVYDADDSWSITLNGTTYTARGQASAHGTFAFVYKKRQYFTQNTILRYTALNTADDLTTSGADSGTGFINITNETDGTERLTALAAYQNLVAIFSRRSIRTYALQAAASENAFQQVLSNTGTLAPRSVLAYGNTDVFYLDDTGIRSIRARDTTNQAFVEDIGSSIDPYIAEHVASLDEVSVERAVSAIEPIDGRFLLAVGPKIFVLSYFPGTKVNAWSYYEPGFTVSDFVTTKRRLYARAGDTIYLYGGTSGEEYPDAADIVVDLPFISAGDPATFKKWLSFDTACRGVWRIQFVTDPDDETKLIDGGRVTGTTFKHGSLALVGEHPIFAPRLTCTDGGKVSMSGIILHFSKTVSG